MGGRLVHTVDDGAIGLNSLIESQFIYSIYLLHVYYVLGTLISTCYPAVNKTKSLLHEAPWSLHTPTLYMYMNNMHAVSVGFIKGNGICIVEGKGRPFNTI